MDSLRQDIFVWEYSYLDKGWPFKLAGMHKSPTEKGLDAPLGGTKVYKFKYCYTADELKTVQDKVQQYIDWVAAGKYSTIEEEGAQKEISDWLKTLP